MTKIEISGPGGTFGDVVLVVREALEAAGATVLLIDEYPPTASDEQLRKMVEGQKVEIKVRHNPWGG